MSQEKKTKLKSDTPEEAAIENILAQWRRERPDIDPAPMAVCGDIWRVGEKLRQGVLANLSEYGLDFAQFDVILTLRRQGRGETLSPSALAKDMMLSTSAMTNRLDRLEKRGLIKRTMDPNDRRGLRIILSDEGFALADEMVVSHVETEEQMLSGLSDEERQQIRQLLGKIKEGTK
ncbi:MAG: MarR family transcriptional regulator [Sneathiella sp.]|nr:MarR family transcriptional regulator [Sneathiella sp.]